jgi:acetyl-CoA carboxylase biotin carboxylase subunit
MLESVLVANRGEIARRVIRTARRMGIRAIAVYSDADADLPFVREADEAVLLGPPPPARSYLDAEAVIGAARRTGASAIHPGLRLPGRERVVRGQVIDGRGLIWIGRRRRRSSRWATRSAPGT